MEVQKKILKSNQGKKINPFPLSPFLPVSILLFLLLPSCFNYKDLSNRNLSDVYRKGEQLFHPEFSVYLTSDTTATLYIKINPKEFLYMRQSDDRFKSSFTIHYNLLESYEATASLGAGLETYEIYQEDINTIKIFLLRVTLPPPLPPRTGLKEAGEPWKGLMVVNIADNQKNYNEDFYVNVDNTGRQNRQSFFVQKKEPTEDWKSGRTEDRNDARVASTATIAVPQHLTVPLFKNYLSPQDTVRISYRNPLIKTLYVHCYFRNFPLAPTPFSFDIHDDFNYQPDSTFIYQVSDTGFISFKKEGFYHFQVDTTEKDGLTLFRFPNSFPNVTTPDVMIESVRYLTTKKEFEEMRLSQNKKASMDKFWFDIGGSMERSKQLIKKYYTRVQDANRFFSSHTEGWRTDRGMIYIIFGKPNNVYKSANAESWIYGTPNNALSLNFFFVRVNNPFTDNDYTLTREPIYEGSWYRAVDVWRQGRAYNDN